MRRVRYPEAVDDFGLRIPLAERNSYILRDGPLSLEDLAYAVQQLELYAGTLQVIQSEAIDSTQLTSVQNAVDAIAASVSTLQTQLIALSNTLTTMPVYHEGTGAPSGALGKNGDTYFDTIGLMRWIKLGGYWQQQ